MKSSARVILFVMAAVVGGCSSGGGSPQASSSGSAAAPSTQASTPAAASVTPSASVVPPASAVVDCPKIDSIAGMNVFDCKVPAPSLANNLLGDPAQLETEILLPLDYETSGRRYPSVYVLAGWTDNPAFLEGNLSNGLKNPVAPNAEAIYVFVGGGNALGGSFYVNSPVTGNWEDAIAKDLVAWVDGTYRTLPAAESRGMAGHSMGGFGAVSIAMHRPDVFGALFAMSPGLFGEGGVDQRIGDETAFQTLVDRAATVPAGADVATRAKALIGSGTFNSAYGAAFVPDPEAPLLVALPIKTEGGKAVLDAELYKRWEAGFGGLTEKIATYGSNLKKLRAIAIDYGKYDEYLWIPVGCHTFVDLATKAGIKVTETIFDGTHQGNLDARMADVMIPFFAANLVR